MDLEYNFLELQARIISVNMKGCGTRIDSMGTADVGFQTRLLMKAQWSIMLRKDLVNIFGQMVINITEHGVIIDLKAAAASNTMM